MKMTNPILRLPECLVFTNDVLSRVVNFLLCHPDCAGVYVNNDNSVVVPSTVALPWQRRFLYVSRSAILPRF